MQVCKVTTVFLILLTVVLADNYMILFPPEMGSQTVALAAAASAMIERNHSVTLITSNEFKDNVKKRMRTGPESYALESYKSLVTVDLFRELQTGLTGHAMKGEYFQMIKLVLQKQPQMITQSCDDLFTDQQLLTRLTKQKFDLVLAHTIMACPVLLAEYLDVQFASVIPAIPPSMFLRLNANPINPAYTPEMPTGFSNKMTFLQRVKNTITSFQQWMMVGVFYRGFDELKQKYNIKPEVPTMESVTHAEVLFVFGHFSLDFPRPYQPNVISVGGISATSPRPLPKVS